MNRIIPITLALALFAGCAHDGPIVDTKGVDPAQYRQDLADCENYAQQVSVGGKAATGAVAGAVIGGLVGAAVGNHETAERAAAGGAVVGGAKGTGRGVREKRQVVRNCLRHRGYAVLN